MCNCFPQLLANDNIFLRAHTHTHTKQPRNIVLLSSLFVPISPWLQLNPAGDGPFGCLITVCTGRLLSHDKILHGRKTGGLSSCAGWLKKWLKQKPEGSWPLSSEVNLSLPLWCTAAPSLSVIAHNVLTSATWIFNIVVSRSGRSWMLSLTWREENTAGICWRSGTSSRFL